MALGFIVGDTVDVSLSTTVIRGDVTRILIVEEAPVKIEIQRPSGSHNEFTAREDADPGDEFDFVTKVG